MSRGFYHSAVRKMMNHAVLRAIVWKSVGRHCRRQLKQLTAMSSRSILLKRDASAIRFFSWARVFADLQRHSKDLCVLLLLMVPQKKREQARGMVALISSMLANMTNRNACFVQTAISLMLFAGHTSSQVSEEHACMCMVCLH